MKKVVLFLILIVGLPLIFAPRLYALPYVPPEELERDAAERLSRLGQQRFPVETPIAELDEYNYPTEYMEILDWLQTMQVTDPGADFGGMREGELDWLIIQTDNTQEALRDWARYAYMTGDLIRYQENIDAAWEYIMNWPAYEEEGAGDPNYYRVHNCGWGLVATMEYTRAYGDSTYMTYGDSCANYIDTYRLSWGQGVQVEPLSASFGAGTLYLYGVWRDNQEWIDAAQEIANDVKTWIEDNPNRLHANETWAMSGGTAMWGVVVALFSDDHEAGLEWLPQYLQEMDTYSGPGQWNNSWTIWYGHAWSEIYKIVQDDSTFANAIWTVDFLLDQDLIDGDGGVPATEDQYTNDQSWTSAYLVWYGIEPIISSDTLFSDIRPLLIESPDQDIPVAVGSTNYFRVEVGNSGWFDMNNVEVTISVDGYTSTETVSIPFTETAVVEFEAPWIPDEPGTATVVITTSHPEDEIPDNDTLEVPFSVWESNFISGTVTKGNNQTALYSSIHFTNLDVNPDTVLYSIANDQVYGTYEQLVVEGNYLVEAIPYEPPYTKRISDTLYVTGATPQVWDFSIDPAEVMVVSEQNDGRYDSYYMEALEEISVDAYLWKAYEREYPYDTMFVCSAVIWSTGKETIDCFRPRNWNHINQYFDDYNGSILLSGQGIQNQWGLNSIMYRRFGSLPGELDIPQVLQLDGTEDDPISRGDSLLIFGTGGAGEQDSTDEVVPYNDNSIPILYYHNTDMAAAVAYEATDPHRFRSIFCAFGIEGINSEVAPYTTRANFLGYCLEWFGLDVDINGIPDPGNGPKMIPGIFNMAAWPNPFNPNLTVQVSLPSPDKLTLTLYDLLGREVTRFDPGLLPGGQHKFTIDGTSMSSGAYFLMLRGNKILQTQRVVLVK